MNAYIFKELFIIKMLTNEEYLMLKPRIKVGHYYEFELKEGNNIAFAVLYGFERGKNKDVYTVMMYTGTDNFEFPVQESLFDTWVKEGRVKEITSDELLVYAV
jgi:hypothetical protein